MLNTLVFSDFLLIFALGNGTQKPSPNHNHEVVASAPRTASSAKHKFPFKEVSNQLGIILDSVE